MRTYSLVITTLLLVVHLGSSFLNRAKKSTSSSSSALSSTLATSAPSEALKEKFVILKKAFPSTTNVVQAGGWNNLVKLSADPKQELVELVLSGLTSTDQNKVEFHQASNDERLEALCLLLYGMGKGFEADGVDGDWALVFTKQGQKSPRFQKLVGKREKAGFSLNTFDISTMTFSGDVKVLKKGLVHSTVKYNPLSEAYSMTSDGKIVLRRIGCDITNAYFKFWRLPGLALPIRPKGGYLEFVYMDQDIRVTRGNRGGLFVHFRPDFLEEQLAVASSIPSSVAN